MARRPRASATRAARAPIGSLRTMQGAGIVSEARDIVSPTSAVILPAMERQTDLSSGASPNPFRTWGLWAVLTGALALGLVFVQIVGPALEPKPSVGTQIGEIAGEIRRSAWRSFLGLPRPPAEPEPVRASDYLAIAAPFLGIAAVVLSLISGLRREYWRFPVYGATLGAAAIVFQYVWWLALLVVGVLLLVAIIENIGDIFGF